MLKKSQEKNQQRQIRNQKYKTLVKNHLRQVNDYLTSREKDSTRARQLVSAVYQALDKATKHGIIHKNQAARKKSQIAKLISRTEPKQ